VRRPSHDPRRDGEGEVIQEGDKVKIIKHIMLYGMSLKGRTGRIVDMGEEYVTLEITGIKWRVRLIKAAVATVGRGI
jgi:uncharacterized Zn ribbon protein